MKILIVGCGSIGERHLRNLKKIFGGEILVCDNDESKLQRISQIYKVRTFLNYDDSLKEKPHLVLICVPTALHFPFAYKSLENNCHVFIEKPITSDLDSADKLIDLAKRKNLKIYVGFNFRFNPYFKEIKKMLDNRMLGTIYSARAYFGSYLPDRHPGQDYRKDYGGKKELGGGVILDAGSHIIDYLSWFFGDIVEVGAYIQKRSKLEIDVEDNAEILLRFKDDLIVNVHIDFLRRPWLHFFEILGEKGTLYWSFSAKECKLKFFDFAKRKWKNIMSKVDIYSMYEEEMKNLLSSLDGGKSMLVDGESARRNLFILQKIIESNKERKFIRIIPEKE
jgi:predicted dehydrogenase